MADTEQLRKQAAQAERLGGQMTLAEERDRLLAYAAQLRAEAEAAERLPPTDALSG